MVIPTQTFTTSVDGFGAVTAIAYESCGLMSDGSANCYISGAGNGGGLGIPFVTTASQSFVTATFIPKPTGMAPHLQIVPPVSLAILLGVLYVLL